MGSTTLCSAVLVVLTIGLTAGAAAPPSGLTVEDGVLMRNGEPYRAMGMNFFSVFYRRVLDPEDTTWRDGLETLSRKDVPFIRFMATAFWPSQMELYEEDSEAFFALLDGVVEAAEELDIGLIPSLFWYDACVPDLVGEPRSAWGDLDSNTIAFMRTYTQQVVTRYKDSPAIWAWEFGNEYDLSIDLPNAADHRPPIWPNLGTAESRSEADDMTLEMLVTAFGEFGRLVRTIDPHRPITSGNATPRPSLHHQRIEGSWQQDTPEQFKANLAALHPDPMNMLSIHVYPGVVDGYFGRERLTYRDLLEVCMEASREIGKPLFVGEFGASFVEEHGGLKASTEKIFEQFDAIEATGVPLAAIWNYDLGEEDGPYNITETNERAFIFDRIAESNRRMMSNNLLEEE